MPLAGSRFDLRADLLRTRDVALWLIRRLFLPLCSLTATGAFATLQGRDGAGELIEFLAQGNVFQTWRSIWRLADAADGRVHAVVVDFAGDDLDEVAALVGVSRSAFVAMHCAEPLRVLATGFAPGFVYLGFHPEALRIPRRAAVRSQVPAGTVLFAAGQTAITSTDIPTGWHVIGRTEFRNFDPTVEPPTRLAAGDMVRFEVAR